MSALEARPTVCRVPREPQDCYMRNKQILAATAFLKHVWHIIFYEYVHKRSQNRKQDQNCDRTK